jgi:RES domain-containing protein
MYGSIEEATVWAEWSHATGGGVAPEDDPRWLCTFDTDLAVVDLRRPEVLDALGVTVADLNASWAPGSPNRACLRVSMAAAAAGAEGMIVPSAARRGAWNLDVLPSGFSQLRRRSRQSRVPAPPAA